MQPIFTSFKSSTRFACFLLAIGFFYGCSSSSIPIDTYINEERLEDALSEIEIQLEKTSGSQELFIKKGELLIRVAEKKSIEHRDSLYREAILAFKEAEILGVNNSQSESIHNLTYNSWLEELNLGTNAYDSEEIDIALYHFENAIILNEAEPTAYLSKSVALYSTNDLDAALETRNQAKDKLTTESEKLYEYLGFLHLQNSNAEEATYYYELAKTNITSNKNIAFGLVNIYISNSELQKAIDLLLDLNNEIPNDAGINNVLGTQLFFFTEYLYDNLTEAYKSNNLSSVNPLKLDAESFSKQAESCLIKAYEIESTNHEYIQSLAVFYNNLTAIYLSLAQIAPEQEKNYFLIKTDLSINSAIKYFELLLSTNPGNEETLTSIKMLKKLQSDRFGK